MRFVHFESFPRTSTDLVLLIKIALLQYVFGIPCMRRTIKEIKTNMTSH
ncbi:transposase [Exiguobacterium sp. OS-77]